MKAPDLRIGNLVYAPNKKDILQISRDMFSYERGLTNLEDLEPIELTEEWLLKMRLKWSEEHKVYYNNGFNIEKIGEMLLERRYGIILKHVHQVQNFYNIVTGEELTIK